MSNLSMVYREPSLAKPKISIRSLTWNGVIDLVMTWAGGCSLACRSRGEPGIHAGGAVGLGCWSR